MANAIRTKGGTSAPLSFPSEFVSAIANLPSGSGITKTTGTVTGNGTNTISIVTARIPDVIHIYRSDIENMTAVTDRANAGSVLWAPGVTGSVFTSGSSITLSNGGGGYNTGIGSGTTPGTNQASYSDGKLYIKSGNNSNLWSASLTYKYEFIFFT